MADDLIYPATNSAVGDMSDYDVDGKKHRESMIARLLQQFREGNFVVEGLEVTAGTGLDVNIAIGECNIDGRRIVINTARTHTLADNTTNYVYLQLSFDALNNVNGVNVVSNTTGTAPNSSVYLSNVTTSTGAIDTIVDTREEHYVLNAVNADSLVSGISDIDILTGTIAHGGTIPLPAGYTQAQCKWFVSISHFYFDTPANDLRTTLYCSANASRLVTCKRTNAFGTFTGTANYMIIGVK